MSSLVTTGPLNKWTRPYPIYDGPRTGDEFLEWNMGQIQFVEPPAELDVLYGLGQLWDMGQVDALFGAATKMFGDAVEAIEFRSQVTPPIVINQPFAPAGKRPPVQAQGATPITTLVLDKAAKPAMYIRLKGGVVYPIEPYGTPTQDYTGYLIGAVGVTLAVGGVIGVKLGQWLFCRKSA